MPDSRRLSGPGIGSKPCRCRPAPEKASYEVKSGGAPLVACSCRRLHVIEKPMVTQAGYAIGCGGAGGVQVQGVHPDSSRSTRCLTNWRMIWPFDGDFLGSVHGRRHRTPRPNRDLQLCKGWISPSLAISSSPWNPRFARLILQRIVLRR